MWRQFDDLLKEKNISLYRMARDTGIDAPTLSRWRHGCVKPNQKNLLAIADYFGVSVDRLIRTS